MVILRGFLIAYSLGWCYIMVPGGAFSPRFWLADKKREFYGVKKEWVDGFELIPIIDAGSPGVFVRNTSGLVLSDEQRSNIARKGSQPRWGRVEICTNASVFQNRFGEDLVMTVTWGVYIQLINHVANLTQEYQRWFQCFPNCYGGLESGKMWGPGTTKQDKTRYTVNWP